MNFIIKNSVLFIEQDSAYKIIEVNPNNQPFEFIRYNNRFNEIEVPIASRIRGNFKMNFSSKISDKLNLEYMADYNAVEVVDSLSDIDEVVVKKTYMFDKKDLLIMDIEDLVSEEEGDMRSTIKSINFIVGGDEYYLEDFTEKQLKTYLASV